MFILNKLWIFFKVTELLNLPLEYSCLLGKKSFMVLKQHESKKRRVPQLIHSFNKCLLNTFYMIGTEGNKKMNKIIYSKSLFEDTHT